MIDNPFGNFRDDVLKFKIREDKKSISVRLYENEEDLQGFIDKLRAGYRVEDAFGIFIEYHKRWVNELSHRLKSMNRDGLTGLFTRQKLEDEKERMTSMMQRGLSLGFVMIDMDDFKDINDTYGHLTGDKVLCEVGRELVNSVRKYDLPFRYGGDEFLVVFHNVNSATLKKLAERIVKRIASLSIRHDSFDFSVTVSAGVCNSTDGKFEGCDSVIEAADAALYKAKGMGKNTAAFYYLP